MPTDAKLAPPVAAIASALFHALLLFSGFVASARSTEERIATRDAWGARSVEVGTVPDSVAPQPARSQPRAPETAAAEKPHPVPTPPDRTAERERLEPSKVGAVRRARPAVRAAASQGPPSSPAASATEAAKAAPAGNAAAEAGGSFGAVGLPQGMRHLATAFTRALPAGSYRDAAWLQLPLGKVGEAQVALHVSESGALEAVELTPAEGVHPVLARMIQRAELLLKSGTFSLDQRKVRGGVERLLLEVTLAQRDANPDELAAPQQLFAQGYKPPTLSQPGFARFTLNSGRHMEAVVRLADQ